MKKLLARLALLLGSTALGLALASWAADRWLPLPSMMFELDEHLLVRPIPGARRVLPLAAGAGGAWIESRFNSRGFRGPEIASPKSAPRVLVLGDSLVMAETSPLEETYCARLEQRLRGDAGAKAEVVNAGVSGYGTDQECLLLESLLAQLEPDLVVLVICAHNDSGDLVRDKLFRLDNRERLVPNHPSFAPELIEQFALARRTSARPALLKAFDRLHLGEGPRPELPGESETAPYIEWYLQGAEAEYDQFVTFHDDVFHTPFEDFYDADLSIRPDSASALFKRLLMRKVLERVRDDCRKAGVPFFALVVPSSVDICPTFRIRVDPVRYPTWTPTRLTDGFAEILGQLSIPFLDLTPVFRAAGPEKLYLGRGDFHWNGAGEDLGAARTAEFLREHALWPPRR